MLYIAAIVACSVLCYLAGVDYYVRVTWLCGDVANPFHVLTSVLTVVLTFKLTA